MKQAAALAETLALLQPPPDRTAAEWADANRILPPGSAEPGPFRSARTPYLVPIGEAVASPQYRRVILITGSQGGKTDLQLNLLGARLDDDPTPAIVVFPTRSAAEGQFEPRLSAMLRSTPSLWARTAKGKANKKTVKTISGVTVRLAWAGSATELASQPAGLALLDELDRMDDVPSEGDPVELVEARGSTFPDFTLFVTSSPTIGRIEEERHPETGLSHWSVADPRDIESRAWRLWQEGTRHEWAWPCPSCGEYFIPRFSLLTWPKGATASEATRSARMKCPHCETLVDDARKTEMNERGVYVSPGQRVLTDGMIEGPRIDSDTASFWVSGLCSPWRPFGRAAARFIEAAHSGDPGRIQAVVNTQYGEPFRVAGEAPKWEAIAALREPYSFDEVPAGVRVITCGVDVQKDRLIFVVRGWGYRLESWLLRHGEIYGETELEPVWSDLATLLGATWGEKQLPIRQTLVDSGYRPGDKWRRPEHRVYTFARRFPGWVRPSKGQDTLDAPVKLARIDVTIGNQRLAQAVELVHVNTDHMKTWIHGRIAWPKGEPGAWHIPHEVSDAYCSEIAAESRLVTTSGRAKWIRVARENHALDAECLALAGAYLLGVHLLGETAPADGPMRGPSSGSGTPGLIVRSKWLGRSYDSTGPRKSW